MSESNADNDLPSTSAAPVQVNDTELASYKRQALGLLMLKKNFQNKIKEMEIALKADSLDIQGDVVEEEILQRIDDLEDEVSKANSKLICQNKALQSCQIGKSLRLHLRWGLKTKEEATAVIIDEVKHTAAVNLVEANNHLVIDYLERLKDIENLKQAVKAKQKTSQEMLRKARKLNQELNKIKEGLEMQPKNDQGLELRKMLNQSVHLYTVISQVFQELIISSKVDWKTDPILENFMISLGKKVKL